MAAPACHVPERIHLSALIFGYGDNPSAAIERLKHESFDDVAASMPDNYAKDIGWFVPSQLRGGPYEKAIGLAPGKYAVSQSQTQGTNVARVDEIRPAASCAQALADYPTDPWALAFDAAYESRAGNTSAAIADYSKEIAADPNSGDARYGRAQAYYAQRRYHAALEDLEHDNQEGGADADVLRSEIESTMGDADLAESDAHQGLAQLHGYMRDESPGHAALGIAYADLGYFKAAIDQFDAVIARHPEDGNALDFRGIARFQLGDMTGAKSDFLQAVRAHPQYEVALLDLALWSFAEGDAAGAKSYAIRAHAAAPSEPYASLWLAIAQGRPHPYTPAPDPEAEPELNAAIHACEAAFYRGIALYVHHQRAAAAPLLREAANACPYREHERAVARRLMHEQ